MLSTMELRFVSSMAHWLLLLMKNDTYVITSWRTIQKERTFLSNQISAVSLILLDLSQPVDANHTSSSGIPQ